MQEVNPSEQLSQVRMVPEKWEDKDGNQRETSTVYVEDLGVSLRWAKVGSVLTSTNPLNNPAIQKGSDIKQPAQQNVPAPVAKESYNAEEDGAPF
jgi:single-stranded DNA-binding protein